MTATAHREVASHLSELESVWQAGMSEAYAVFRPHAAPEVALAAALVESAVDLQQLGRGVPEPPHLLLGDLCLARGACLLAHTRDQRLQIAFARVLERVAAAAAGGPGARPLREQLIAAIGTAVDGHPEPVPSTGRSNP